jgi:hypothetical protein
MILRPFEPLPPGDQDWQAAWPVVERIQRQKYESCWMITQPSHAALSGEIAAKLQSPLASQLDAGLVRAIALHDAGWGIPDAQAIVHSRAKHAASPKSFLEIGIAEYLEAWSQSAEVAQSVLPAGGYIVSRHFSKLAEHRIAHGNDGESDRKKLQAFLTRESQRQKKLASKQERTAVELEALTDVLQFCDLLSLYICSGARNNVQFPEYFGVAAKLQVEGENYRLEPGLVKPASQFGVAALRYPTTKKQGSMELKVTVL